MFPIKRLESKKEELLDELYMLHFAEPSPEVYKQRRSELEYHIACIEEAIENEKALAPLRWMLYGFIVVAIGLLFWAFLKSK